ncbi:MAG TPA: hypothetical protein VJU61_07545, partial [Polyangiaceae bacterium]|nr:hypothetical protein [Polyangiaceae bacterium]
MSCGSDTPGAAQDPPSNAGGSAGSAGPSSNAGSASGGSGSGASGAASDSTPDAGDAPVVADAGDAGDDAAVAPTEPEVCDILPNTGSLSDGDANIDLNSLLQRIAGFGGMDGGFYAELTAAQVDTAFGNGPGQLGMSIMRI